MVMLGLFYQIMSEVEIKRNRIGGKESNEIMVAFIGRKVEMVKVIGREDCRGSI